MLSVLCARMPPIFSGAPIANPHIAIYEFGNTPATENRPMREKYCTRETHLISLVELIADLNAQC